MAAFLPTFVHELTLERPAWLLLLTAAPGLWWIGRRSLGDFSRRQLGLQTALRILVLAGVAVALARPSLRRDVSDVSLVVVADVSASVSDAALGTQRQLIADLEQAAARRRRARPVPMRVVRFARDAAEWGVAGRTMPPLERFAPPAGMDTDIAKALALAGGLTDPGGIPRLVLLSDGKATAGDAMQATEQAAARGVRIDVVALDQARVNQVDDAGDIAIERIDAPDDVRPRAPFDLQIRLLSDHAGHADLRLERDGRPHQPIADRTVDFAAGATVVSWPTRIDDAGISIYRARIVSSAGNAHPENDQGVIAVATTPAPRVLCIDSQPEAVAAFTRALEAETIAVDVRGPREAISATLLQRYDLVILSDVARAAVSDQAMSLIETFVRNGGGLLMAGGPGSFGSGGYAGSRLAPLLPVRLDLPEKMDEATLALALVIDRSGSMSGPKMDLTKEAARATAEMMPPTDQIAVIVFDNQAVPVVRLQQAANRMRILSDIARIQASGGTNILAGLREAVDELTPARARKKHVILLSDGQSAYDGIADLVEGASTAQITFSAVGVGDGADQTLLQMIASRGGGRFYHTRDPASIPRIFSRETSQLGRRSVVEEPTTVRVAKRAEVLAGIPFEEAPKLRGYTVTRSRPEADLLLTTGDGAPLLARWQVGLGLVGAWTSDIKPRWSADWARWVAYPKFWAQVVRSTMRRRAATHLPLVATLDNDNVDIAIDAVGADDQFLSGLQGDVEIVEALGGGAAGGGGGENASAARRKIALTETAPGHYEARAQFPGAVGGGAMLLDAVLMRGTLPIAEASGRLTLPFARELRPRTGDAAAVSGPALLRAVAARTGGTNLGDPARAFDPGADHRTAQVPLRTEVLLVTIGLFLVDVLLRRVRLRRLGGDTG
ncbi:MAG TPA: VWA domain-containing protein [Polyangia bacterium]|nr:VWA domain-containing protein [Polyangia bacterium]